MLNSRLKSEIYACRLILNRVYRYIFIERCHVAPVLYDWSRYPQRHELINAILARNGFASYLEIGCREDQCFSRIQCHNKVGVDPFSGGTIRLTSDEFFRRSSAMFDLIFVDGLHLCEFTSRDMENALSRLTAGGVVMVHDCLPLNVGAQSRRIEQLGPWNGDVWKAFLRMRTRKDLDSAVCAIDHGIGLIVCRPNSHPLTLDITDITDFRKLKFRDFVRNQAIWMNITDFSAAVDFVSSGAARQCSA